MEVYHAQTRLESRTGTISTHRTTRTNHRELWSGKEVTFKGKYYQTKKAKLYTPPASPIPIYVSTLVPESANFAGKYGDGLITIEQTAIQYQKKYWAGTYIPALFNQKIYTPKMSAQNGEIVGADSIKKAACVSRNADDHVKFVKQYIDLGFNTIYFHSATPNQKNFIDAYARDVLPQLRRYAG